MRRDERVFVLGEDVARGGLWGQYRDFLSEFGEERVVSTPISESTIMGAGLGAALVGMRHGMWRNSAAQHSQMLEAWFAHLPGVIVVTPSTAADTAGLLVQAIRSDDPV